MRVFAYKSPTVVKALQDREFPWFRSYFKGFHIQEDVLFEFGDYREDANPIKDAFDDYNFNEHEESNKLFAKYGKFSWHTVVLNWNPRFEES